MTGEKKAPVIEGLLDPAKTLQWPTHRWEGFLQMARSLNLLAKFSFRAEAAGITDKLPPKVYNQLTAARNLAEHHRRTVSWEVQCLCNILSYRRIDFILLKGGAYIMAGLPAGLGRKVSDVDILVRNNALEKAEKTLLLSGWGHVKLDPYDQRYYRRYMHEIPPLKHKDRKTYLDVHHTILPETGRLHPNPDLLWEEAQTVQDEYWRVLSPEDMVLHSAAHLFQDGDLEGGLRDLFDLDDLMREFSVRYGNFWKNLIERAQRLDLTRPLFYALTFCHEILGTPIPKLTMKQAQQSAPNPAVVRMMRYLAHRTLVPTTPDGCKRRNSWQKTALYIRSHWLRMPPGLLANHLVHKAWRAAFPPSSD